MRATVARVTEFGFGIMMACCIMVTLYVAVVIYLQVKRGTFKDMPTSVKISLIFYLVLLPCAAFYFSQIGLGYLMFVK